MSINNHSRQGVQWSRDARRRGSNALSFVIAVFAKDCTGMANECLGSWARPFVRSPNKFDARSHRRFSYCEGVQIRAVGGKRLGKDRNTEILLGKLHDKVERTRLQRYSWCEPDARTGLIKAGTNSGTLGEADEGLIG